MLNHFGSCSDNLVRLPANILENADIMTCNEKGYRICGEKSDYDGCRREENERKTEAEVDEQSECELEEAHVLYIIYLEAALRDFRNNLPQRPQEDINM